MNEQITDDVRILMKDNKTVHTIVKKIESGIISIHKGMEIIGSKSSIYFTERHKIV